MFSSLLNQHLARLDIHYGWVMALLVFLMTIFSSAIGSAPQLIILPITQEFGWQISDITNAIGIMFFTLACLAPFSGALMLNLGVTPVVLIALGLDIIGLGLCIIAFEKWHFLITIGVFLGAASGIIGLGLAATIASRWFLKRRGLVVGILTAAFAAGQLLFVLLMAWITNVLDWRYALLIPITGALISSILFLFFGYLRPKIWGYLGIDNITRIPSSHLSNVKLPPCCSAILYTMARQIPVPFMLLAFFPLFNGAVNCFKFSAGSLSP